MCVYDQGKVSVKAESVQACIQKITRQVEEFFEKLGKIGSYFIPAHLINISTIFSYIAFKNGFLMRGAITKGMMIHNGSQIVGKPLNDADEIEKSVAIYPRVILTNEKK